MTSKITDTSSNKERKVKKATTVRRPKFADEKYLGSEPVIKSDMTQAELARAYSWFNYFYSSEDAKSFAISYLKSVKYDKETIRKLGHIKPHQFTQWIGWNCRLLAGGSVLDKELWEKTESQIKFLVGSITEDDGADSGEDIAPITKVVSIQERINNKASNLIGELEEQLDVFFQEGVIQFDVKKWSLEKGIKPQIAKRINEHFHPQYEEIVQVLSGKDKELVEAYRGWRKPVLKIMSLFIKKICDHMTELNSAGQAVRKPRKKKVKPASELVSKLNYCVKHEDLTSISPTEIIGASQLWIFNTKTRNLSVYNAVGNSGLSIRGSTITGFDQESSLTKKLRKPESVLKPLLEGGKIYLRKVMDNITTTPQKSTGRINKECILLRVVK